MNRQQRGAEAAEARKRDTQELGQICPPSFQKMQRYLARAAGPTATGAALMHPDGSMSYISADVARALYSTKPARGHA